MVADDLGGWLVFVMDVVAMAILGVVLAYATFTYRRRRREAADRGRAEALRRGEDLRHQTG